FLCLTQYHHVPLRQLITWINIIKPAKMLKRSPRISYFLLLDQTAPHQKWEAAVLEDQAGTAVTSATAEHPNLLPLRISLAVTFRVDVKIHIPYNERSNYNATTQHKLSVSYPLVNVRSKGTSWLFLN
ncbi:hypothetical protein ACJX0J_037078, partial [Zea mays]